MPSAGIVYEGVLASRTPDENNNNQNRYEGTLFNGLKFWISQRVPDRKSLVELVKANGGKTALLEKHADVLIADHARKDVPVGSVSWKYIKDSISEGELADMDIYRIEHPTTKKARPASADPKMSIHTKRTRTPFTPQDDHILVHWVLRGEGIARGQGSSRGNQLYRDLAERYPHHTFQSWRDRFIKQYDHLNRDALAAMLPRDFQPPLPSASPYFDEDDRIVIDFIKRSRQAEIPEQNMYKKLAEQHPHRSWQDWRSRCIKLQATTNREESDPGDPVDHASPDTPEPSLPQPSLPKPSLPEPRLPKPSLPQPSLPEPTPRAVTRPHVTATPKSADQAAAKRRLSAVLNRARQEVPTRSSPVPPATQRLTSSANKKLSPHSTPSRLEDISRRARQFREEKKKIKSASIIQQAWRSYQARKQIPWRQALMKFQALAQGFVIRRALAPFLEESRSEISHDEDQVYSEDEGSVDLGQSVEPGTSSGPSQIPREQFYHYFDLYNQAVDNSPVRWVKIGSQSVETWDLWSAVTGQDVPAHARDWQVIAEDLDFDWIAEPDIPNQLRAAFQEHLADFEDNWQGFMADEHIEDSDEDGQEGEENEEMEDDQFEEDEEEVDAEQEKDITLQQDHNTAEFRSSPPIVGTLKSSGGLKRNVEQLISSPLASMTRKRLRYNFEDEVPESPPKRRESPLPPIPEVTSRPEEEAVDATLVNDDGDAAEDMPMFDGDEGDYEAEEDDREDDEDVFFTQPQQFRQATASISQESSLARNRPATQPSLVNQAIDIPSDSDSDSESSSDGFGTPLNPPRAAPERKPVAAVPAVRRQLPPRECTAPAARSPPPRFRIPSEPFASNDQGNLRPAQAPASSSHPPRPSAPSSSAPVPILHQQHQHPRSSRPPSSSSYPPPLPKNLPPHGGRDLGGGIASEDPVAIVKRYMFLGYKRSDCCKGVFAATHDPNIAGQAIYAVAKDKKLPTDVPGIWTESDDEGLQRVVRARKKEKEKENMNDDEEEDEERILKVVEMRRVKEVERRLLEKHGRKRMESRREMLRYWPRV